MSAQHPRVTIQDTEMHRLSSACVDQEYNILVALPPGYADSGKTYPTLYATDGDLIFGGLTQSTLPAKRAAFWGLSVRS